MATEQQNKQCSVQTQTVFTGPQCDPSAMQHTARPSTPPGNNGLSVPAAATYRPITMILPAMTPNAAVELWRFLSRAITGQLPQSYGVITSKEIRLLLQFEENAAPCDWDSDDYNGEDEADDQHGSAEC